MVYTAGSRALAALEMLVHLTTPGSRAKPYAIIEVSFSEDLMATASSEDFPVEAGDSWLRSCKSLALRVPSIVVPEEPNYLINPDHPDFAALRIGKPREFRFDSRI